MIQRYAYEIDGGQSCQFLMLGNSPRAHRGPGPGERLSLNGGEVGRHVVGSTTIVGLHTDAPYIVAAHVEQARRGEGIGTALILHCIDEARRQRCPHVYAFAHQVNTRAIDLYRRLGFQQVKGFASMANRLHQVFAYPLAGRLDRPLKISTDGPLDPAFDYQDFATA